MPSFDYIESKELRQSLESDYQEMQQALQVEAWKAAQVLAGSIAEALLIDYLTSTEASQRPPKDPLRMDLSEAIELCKAEGVISERTSDLCSVIRSYRNLIHPGRMVRLGENPPDKSSGAIAQSLIEIIASEIATRRRASVGLTAEQLLSKVIRDSNSLTLLKHFLTEVRESQKARLLLDLIPEAYFNAEDDPFDSSADRLKAAHRQILDSCSDQTRKTAAEKFVNVLREGDGHFVTNYSEAFFKASDLTWVPPQHLAMVKDHLFARIPRDNLTPKSIRLLHGIEHHLEPRDIIRWFDPIIRTLVQKTPVPGVDKAVVRQYLMGAVAVAPTEFVDALSDRFDVWTTHFDNHGMSEQLEITTALKSDVEAAAIPF